MQKMLAIVIPVYNEGENLEILIPRIFESSKKYKVFVVDDNSLDNTSDILGKLNKKYKNIIHIKRKAKLGRGSAVIEGFKYAFNNTSCEYFLEMDADLSHDPKDFSRLTKNANPNSVVIGSRYIKGSKILNIPKKRVVLSKCANFAAGLLLNIPIHDNTNGLRLYSRAGVKYLIKHKYKSTGFVAIPESTYLLFRKEFKLVECHSTFVNRKIGGSKADLR